MKEAAWAILALLAAPAALADPCSAVVRAQPPSPIAGEPVAIYYSMPFRFFLDPPSFVIEANQISIDQTAFIADPAFPGHVPCAEKLLQVGSFEPGSYSVVVHLGSATPLVGSFLVRPSTIVVCAARSRTPLTTGPDSGTVAASVKANGYSLLLHFENNRFSEKVGEALFYPPRLGPSEVDIEGGLIHVTQTYVPFDPGPVTEAGPGFYAIFCQSEDIDLGVLGPGKYTVIWKYLTPAGPVAVTASFSIEAYLRGRAIRPH
jgi:hypothetical protein